MQPTGELCPERTVTLESRPGGDALRRLLEINCFYVLSAGLMMLGCFMLVRSGALSGTKFQRTLHSLLVLQAYEGLVIVTAAVIARRLLQISDVVTLLAIELVLLLDPTFFSNSIATFQRVDALAVNVGCLMLVPVKLVILARLLRIRIRPGTCLALLAAGGVVYLSEAPLAFDELPLSHASYFILLSWTPLLIASLVPLRGRALGEDERMTSGQRDFLEKLIIGLPLFTAFAHFVESSLVHRIDLAPMLLAPTAMAVGLVFARNLRRIIPLDAAIGIALLLSLTPFNRGGKVEIHATTEISEAFVGMHGPLLLTGVAAAALYTWFLIRHRCLAALLRLAALGFIGFTVIMVKLGIVGWVLAQLGMLVSSLVKGSADVAEWTVFNPSVPLAIAAGTLAIVALRWTNIATLFLACAAVIVLAFGTLPGPRADWVPEIMQALVVALLALSHLRSHSNWHGMRGFVALAAMTFAFGRMANSPALWPVLILIAEVIACFIAALALRDRSYLAPALIWGAIGLGRAKHESGIATPPAVVVIGLGLALFAVGIWVSFNRDRILDWLAAVLPEKREEPDEAHLTGPEL